MCITLAVGGVRSDRTREATGSFTGYDGGADGTGSPPSGVFYPNGVWATNSFAYGSANIAAEVGVSFALSRQMPTGPRISPASYGVLPCVYLGS